MSIHTPAMERKSPDPDVVADAERWYARLMAADCKASERMEFQTWRAAPERAAAFAATERLWQQLGQLAGHPELEQLSRQILAATAQRRRPYRRRLAIAASVLIALVVGGAFLAIQNRETPAIAYATEPGERSTIKLADGSQLILNVATEIDVRLGSAARLLTLRKGEALFSVAHDKRPFKVVAGDGEVTALGTRFQIRNEAQKVVITLVEGRVAVGRREQRVRLDPGDQLSFTGAAPEMRRRSVDPEVVTSWTTGRLRFRSTSLEEAVNEVNRYADIRIRIADPALARIPISGTFEIGDGASVAFALEALLPLHAVKKGDEEILLQPRE